RDRDDPALGLGEPRPRGDVPDPLPDGVLVRRGVRARMTTLPYPSRRAVLRHAGQTVQVARASRACVILRPARHVRFGQTFPQRAHTAGSGGRGSFLATGGLLSLRTPRRLPLRIRPLLIVSPTCRTHATPAPAFPGTKPALQPTETTWPPRA